MENEEEIKIESNKITSSKITTKLYLKINKVILLQLINLLFIALFYFSIYKILKKGDLKIKHNSKINDENNNSVDTLTTKIKLLKLLTNNDEFEYKGMLDCLTYESPESKYCIYHLISPKTVIGKNRILIGEKSDGCYVLLDDFENIKIAYSFGIYKNIQFDESLANKGIDIYMYDHTINSLPFENYKFHWKKIGLCGTGTNKTNLKTLEELLHENGHTNETNMILKMDIEKWEWESINTLNEEILKKFKYIAIEYHFEDESIGNYTILYYNVLKKISKTHQSFYARCNGDRSWKINFGPNRICHILEVSYVIKKENHFIKDETIYPMYEFDYSIPKKGKLETNLNILKLFDE